MPEHRRLGSPSSRSRSAQATSTSIEELVRKCLSRRDYDQMIQIIERIPEERRKHALQTLLEQAREKVDEIAFLICEIDEADRLEDRQTALRKAEELLKIKPGHHRAQAIQEKYSGYGDGSCGPTRASCRNSRKPWNEGGWIPWSVLAFGLAVFAGMYGVIVISLGNKTAIVIDIKDPHVEVAVKGTTLTVTGPDKQTVKVEPGEQELKITASGLEAATKSFSLKRGETKTVTVSIVKQEIVALLDNEVVAVPPTQEVKSPPSLPVGGKGPSVRQTPVDGDATAVTLPSTFKNDLGMEFVLVPKGKSWLGGGGGRPGEKEVEIASDFYLGKYEVTQEEWQAVAGTNPSFFARGGGGRNDVVQATDAELKRFPVEHVSWDAAQAFLQRLNAMTKETSWTYRLPTEVEWEYACRGGPQTNRAESAYHFYLDKPTNELSPDQANFQSNQALKRTCRVGSYRPNRLGLYDMHGNVWELCDDALKSLEGTPVRAARGGSWYFGSRDCEAAFHITRPSNHRLNNRGMGLRLARVRNARS